MRTSIVYSTVKKHLPCSFRTLSNGYKLDKFKCDIMSGITVGIVALPLSMAFAIASGVSPEKGLFTAIVAGFIISALGGTRFQVGGPTGAFVVIIAGVIARHGYDGLVVTTLIAGLILIFLGCFGFGKLLKFIPYPVTTGFTSGIGLLILTTQLKEFFGLNIENMPAEFAAKVTTLFHHLPYLSISATTIGLITLVVMLVVRKYIPKIPAPIAGIIVASLVTKVFGLNIETIGSHFGGIPATLPSFTLPNLDAVNLKALLPEAITIALLAGMESLLSAVVADGMTGEKHDSSTELVAQGFANLASVLFGGIPATGAIARTATNIRSGAFSPISGIIHAITLCMFVLFCAPLASAIPLSSLAGVLIIVAWDMSDVTRFKRLLKAPRSDSFVLVTTFLLTIFVDLTVAVEAGVVMAAILFMRRMSDVSDIHKSDEEISLNCPERYNDNGKEVVVYDIGGPFFFGMTQRFVDVMRFTRSTPDILVLRMKDVPCIDATGVEALENVVLQLRRNNVRVVFAEMNERVAKVVTHMGTHKVFGEENIIPNLKALCS